MLRTSNERMIKLVYLNTFSDFLDFLFSTILTVCKIKKNKLKSLSHSFERKYKQLAIVSYMHTLLSFLNIFS